MKIAVSSYSFEKLMKKEGIQQIDTIAKAKQLGFDAIEFADILNPPEITKKDYAVLLKKECDDQDIVVSNLAVSANLIYGSNGDIEKEIRSVCENIDYAEILGVKAIRHDVSWGINQGDKDYFGYSSLLDRFVYACKAITEYGKQKGIKTMVENHGHFFQDLERIEMLLEKVADRNFGFLADMGNFLCADQDPCFAYGKLAPYIFYAHAKDFYFKKGISPNPGKGYMKTRSGNYLKATIIGHGDVPVTQCISLLKENGYDGYLGVEFEGMEEPMEALEIGLSNLKRYI